VINRSLSHFAFGAVQSLLFGCRHECPLTRGTHPSGESEKVGAHGAAKSQKRASQSAFRASVGPK
jgi:hypothetical protein